LLVACESNDPYSVTIVDPKTCVSLWSYKGSELQGAEVGCAEPVGNNGELMLIATKKRPVVHCVAVNRHDRFDVRSVLNKPLESVVTTSDGTVVFGAIESNIFTWLISSGELLSVIAAHYQNITCLCLSSDDGLLISGACDGTINVYLVADILSYNPGGLEPIKPYRQWHSHSLKITSLSLTCLSNARVLSTSLDHAAAIHSVTMDECLLKISGDQALTASCFDPAETSIFLGTDSGAIFRFPLYCLGLSEKMVNFNADKGDNNFFTGHSSTITKLAVNHDASLLASGDSGGNYIVWDAFSRQCLRTVGAKGNKFLNLRLRSYRTFQEILKKKGKSEIITIDGNDNSVDSGDDEVILIDEVDSSGNVKKPGSSAEIDGESNEIVSLRMKNADLMSKIEQLKTELNFVRKKNQEIFKFASEIILDEEKK
uniref:WD_REPEATS_REGION domain-containing protein n=1 Tax=Syphacia muris TaxID=451379 RepID=A0A0N5AKH4_9BILA